MSAARRVLAIALLSAGFTLEAQETAPAVAPAPLELIPVQPGFDAPAAAPVRDPASPTQLGDMVVTAQKTKQSSRKVPIALTAMDGDFIKDTAAASLADLAPYVPNVRVEAHSPGSPQVYIRGFGTNAFNPAFEGSVAFVQDDLYLGRPGYFTESMFDIDRVEVLRGPQGTLFGKNSTAGVFNVTTKGPAGDPGANLDLFTGTQGEQRIEGGAGGMFTPALGARLGFLYRDVDGRLYNQYLDRTEDALNQHAFRTKFLWKPLNRLSTELTLSTSRTDVPFAPYQLDKLDADTRTYLRNFDPNIEDDPKNFRTSFDTRGWMDKGADTGSLKTDYALGDWAGLSALNSTLILGASRFFIGQYNDLDASPADLARLDNHENHHQQSAELRVTGRSSSLFGFGAGTEFVGGLFHYQSSYSLLARVLAGKDLASYATTDDAAELISQGRVRSPVAGLPVSPPGLAQLGMLSGPLLTDGDDYRYDYLQKDRADALYGQSTIRLTEKWALVPGVRLGIETKTVDVAGRGECASKTATAPVTGPIAGALPGTLPGTLPAAPSTCIIQTLINGQDYSAPDRQRKEYDLSPKLALQYFADYGVNYYASFARATKSGGFNALSLNPDHLEFQGEKAKTYELGAKGRFFNRSLSLNLGVYHTDFDDLQVLAFNGVAFDVGNAAAVSNGIEGDFQWLTPYRPLRLLGSFGLLDAHYTDYRNGPAPIADGLGATQDLSGKRVAYAPLGTAALTPVLSLPLMGPVNLTLSGDVLYQGGQYTDTDLDPNVYVPSNVKFNARVIFSDSGDRWSLALGGTNLADTRTLNQVIDTIFFPGTYQAQQAAGRQLYAQLSLKI